MTYVLNNFMCSVLGRKEKHSWKSIAIFYGILFTAMTLLSLPVIMTF